MFEVSLAACLLFDAQLKSEVTFDLNFISYVTGNLLIYTLPLQGNISQCWKEEHIFLSAFHHPMCDNLALE